jgi:hypothetical protein
LNLEFIDSSYYLLSSCDNPKKMKTVTHVSP